MFSNRCGRFSGNVLVIIVLPVLAGQLFAKDHEQSGFTPAEMDAQKAMADRE